MTVDFSEAVCAKDRYRNSRHHDWFPEVEDYEKEERSRALCQTCPVQFDCAQQALTNRERFGIWGGMEEFRVRRALGVDSYGNDRVRNETLLCPFCNSSDLTISKKKNSVGYPVECNYCSITWVSYKTPDKVLRTLKRHHDTDVGKRLGRSRTGSQPK